MKVTVVAASINLVDLLARHLSTSSTGFSRTIVVFPEQRPGHYLRKALGERIGHSFLPPSIYSLDEFIDFLYSHFLQRDEPLLETVEAVSLLYHLNQARPGHSFSGQKQARLTFDEFFAIGNKIFQDLEELKMGQITPDKFLAIDELAGEKIQEKTRARLQKMSYFYENFYPEMERRCFSTRASRLEKVLEKIEPDWFSSFDEVILAGFYLLTAAEFELLNKVLEAEKTWLFILKGTGFEEMLKRIRADRSDLEEINGPEGNIEPELEFCQSPDSHGQLFHLNSLLHDKIARPLELSEKRVIVLPAVETLIPVVEQTLARLPETGYNISVGYPLTRTPLYNFFDSLFKLLETAEEDGSDGAPALPPEEKFRLYVPDYLNFVLHPYTKNIYFPSQPGTAEYTRILFHLMENNFNQKKGRLFWSLQEMTDDPDLKDNLEKYTGENPRLPSNSQFIQHLRLIHQQTIIPFLSLENINDFGVKLIHLLDFISEESTAPLHVLFEPYARAFYRQLEILQSQLLTKQKFSHRSGYFQLFRRLFSEARVRFPGTPLRGWQVLGFWETRCLQFDEVYLLDMNDDVLPGTSKVDSLLPAPLRKALGLRYHESLEKRIEYHLSLLVAGAKKVHYFFVENDEKQKSRYVEKAIWRKQKQEKETDENKYIKKVSYRIALQTQMPPDIPKTEKILHHLENMTFSASSLNTYLKCPVGFFYAHVLGLSEKEELAESLERDEIGTLVHAILRQYFWPYRQKKLPAKPAATRLKTLIDNEFNQRRYPSPLTGSFFLMRKQIEQHLTEFLNEYQQKVVTALASGHLSLTLLDLEKDLKFDYELGQSTFHLKGKIDRTEKRGENMCLLDYKTSASERNQLINLEKLEIGDRSTWPQAIKSLQLPFYQLLASGEYNLLPEDIYSAVIILGRNRLNEKIEYAPLKAKNGKKHKGKEDKIFPLSESDEEKSERQENFRLTKQVIDQLLLEVVDGRQPFSAKFKADDSCSYCPFTSFCGQ
ncbi:MAG: PD-(D/E)XK nuclease family protein [Acidobacteriota bacterium]|nr:PD-(D/E)XK nuclease family protein [Acidobacteriota bacterium]